LIDIPAISFDPLFFALGIEFFESEFGGQELTFIFGLNMIAQRIPAMFFRPVNQACPYGVQVYSLNMRLAKSVSLLINIEIDIDTQALPI